MSATNEVTGAAQEQAGAVAATTKDQAANVAATTKDQAANVAGNAGQAAQDVAGTAKDQAANVAAEVKTQARDLLGETREQISSQADVQTRRLAQTVRSVADELTGLASGRNEHPGPITDLTSQLADRAHGAASHLEGSSPEQLLEDLRRFARQRTGLFMLGAGAAGFLTARLAKAASANKDDGPSGSADYAVAAPTHRPAVTAAPPNSGGWETPSMGAATAEPGFYGEPSVADPSPSPASSAMSGDLPSYGGTGYSDPGYREPGLAQPAGGGIRPVDPVREDTGLTEGPLADELLYDEPLDERGLR